jgi:ABC-2 type transport system ATP-binding protein
VYAVSASVTRVPALLEATDLRVRRGRRTVLDGVRLTLEPGALVHLTGANGAGKTSLLRVLAGLNAPRAGVVRRAGACAFLPERVVLAGALRPREWLGAMRALRGLNRQGWDADAAAAGLAPAVLDDPASRLSKGTLQRVALIEALRAAPRLLLLDEPFAGLDREGRAWLARGLAERAGEGGAVLLTDHAGDAGGLALTGALRITDGRVA